MSFWSRSTTTSILLGVIAVLLLILVVQNANKGSSAPLPPPMSSSGEMPATGSGGLPPGHPPMGGAMGGGAMGSDGNFDPALMVMTAMVCPDDSTATLDAQTCTGKEADTRRDFVREVQKKETSIRLVFDSIVKKFGDEALTEQARAIRKSRRPANSQ